VTEYSAANGAGGRLGRGLPFALADLTSGVFPEQGAAATKRNDDAQQR
jgi:hypothetical protein